MLPRQQQQATLFINHDLPTLNGTVLLGGNVSGNLDFGGFAPGNQTISGTGNVVFGANGNSLVYNANSRDADLGSGSDDSRSERRDR